MGTRKLGGAWRTVWRSSMVRGYYPERMTRMLSLSLFVTLEVTMRAVLLAAILSLAAFSASAQSATTCKSQADEKKLVGAALKSFMTKCERDAQATCDTSAKEKKLAGAAKTSFTKKCVTDAKGA